MKISQEFVKPTNDQWQKAAMKTLKIEDLESLERKLNYRTAEGITLKTYYPDEGIVHNIINFPELRTFARFVRSDSVVENDESFDLKMFFTQKKIEQGPDKWIFQIVAKNDVEKFGNEYLVDVLSFSENALGHKSLQKDIQNNLSHDSFLYFDLAKLHNAGASASTELAALLYWIQQLEDICFKQAQVFVNVATDSLYFTNIAKLRALRFMWERMTELKKSQTKLILVNTHSLREQTIFDPWVNMLRSTSAAAVGFLGGADILCASSFDELSESIGNKKMSELGAKQSRNILHILKEESFLQKVIDPGKGSYAIEKLTAEFIEIAHQKAIAYQQKIDLKDFMENLSHEVKESSEQRFELVQKRKLALVGINDFANIEDKPEDIFGEIDQREVGLFPMRRQSWEFESLRLSMDKTKKILVLGHGNPAKISARLMFCQNYFEVLGIKTEVISNLEDIDSEGGDVIGLVICAVDDEYHDLFVDFQKTLTNIQIPLFIAGKKFEKENCTNIFAGQNVLMTLKNALNLGGKNE